MEKLNIICIDDQREVLSTIVKDLDVFESFVSLEECESADEAWEVIDEIDANGDYVAVVISDHVMPGKSGVDFLTELNRDQRFVRTRKMLLTGLATHKDTIYAINQAGIDFYLEKPWSHQVLVQHVKQMLTHFVLETGLEFQDYMPVLDQDTLYQELRKRN